MSDASDEKKTTLPPAADALLDAVVGVTDESRPLSPRAAELARLLRRVRLASPADAELDRDRAVALVAAATDRVPVAARGAPADWQRMHDRVAQQLLDDDAARAKLNHLWSWLGRSGGDE